MLSPTEEIKAKLDIVDVVSEYFPLKPSGVNHKARCPFHEEKTPSFMVNREKQFYHCFGCNAGGDVFTFIQEMEKIEFPEALKILANKAGVKLPAYNPEMSNLKTRLLAIQEEAVLWFSGQLMNSEAGKKALEYLRAKRKLSDQTIKEWQLGYALDSWEALSRHLKSKNYTDEEIIQSGLVVVKQNSKEYYDRFRDRIMFPIEDYHGNIVGFTGRAMKEEESAKYVNSPQGLVYNKSEVIFGLYRAKQAIKEADRVVVVEGNTDVIASHSMGVKNVVAVSGTALTEDQIRILERYTNNIIFAFDADEAGMRAAERSIELSWQRELAVKVIAIDKDLGKDPDEVIQKDPGKWRELIEGAVPAMEYFFKIHLAGYKPEDVESKKRVAGKLLSLIIKLGSSIEEDFYIKKLAERLDVGERPLREAVDKARGRVKKDVREQVVEEKGSRRVGGEENIRAMGERLLAYMLLDRDYVTYISENLELAHLPAGLVELYKSLVVYYTKKDQEQDVIVFMQDSYPDLVSPVQRLVMLKESELRGLKYSEAIGEIKKYILFFKHSYIKSELKKLAKEIEAAERELGGPSGGEKRRRLDELMAEHVRLSAELS